MQAHSSGTVILTADLVGQRLELAVGSQHLVPLRLSSPSLERAVQVVQGLTAGQVQYALHGWLVSANPSGHKLTPHPALIDSGVGRAASASEVDRRIFIQTEIQIWEILVGSRQCIASSNALLRWCLFVLRLLPF